MLYRLRLPCKKSGTCDIRAITGIRVNFGPQMDRILQQFTKPKYTYFGTFTKITERHGIVHRFWHGFLARFSTEIAVKERFVDRDLHVKFFAEARNGCFSRVILDRTTCHFFLQGRYSLSNKWMTD